MDEDVTDRRWPLTYQNMYPRERWIWFEQLWTDVVDLQARYHLPVRKDWWQDSVQVEALAALAAWVERYDSGEWDDPPGKLALLYDIERVAALMSGADPFLPDRDRGAFASYVVEALECQPSPSANVRAKRT